MLQSLISFKSKNSKQTISVEEKPRRISTYVIVTMPWMEGFVKLAQGFRSGLDPVVLADLTFHQKVQLTSLESVVSVVTFLLC